jgi:hypothetical protein
MPIVQSLMDKLIATYGEGRATSVYYAMEAEGSGPFARGAKYHDLHVAFADKHHLAPITTKKRPKKGVRSGSSHRRRK